MIAAFGQVALEDERLAPILKCLMTDIPIRLECMNSEMKALPANNYSRAIAAAIHYIRSEEQNALDIWIKEMQAEVDILYVSCRFLDQAPKAIQEKALAALKAVFDCSEDHQYTILDSALASHFEA